MEGNENIEEQENSMSPQQELEEMLLDIEAEERLFDKKTKEFLKRHRKGEKIPTEETDLHTQHRKLINQLQKSYSNLYKIVYPKGTNKGINFPEGRPDLDKIKEMDCTIGGIVRKIG